MDHFGIPRGTIREAAFRKLALVTGQHIDAEPGSMSPQTLDNLLKLMDETARVSEPDLTTKISANDQPKLSSVAISLREYEVLIALCDLTSGTLQSPKYAKVLLRKFTAYLLELPTQKFAPLVVKRCSEITKRNRRLRDFLPKSKDPLDANGSHLPWLDLAERLSAAILNLSAVTGLQSQAIGSLKDFILLIFHEKTQSKLQISHYLALLGFIKALIANPTLLTTSLDAFNIFVLLDLKIDNPRFLTNVEVFLNANFSALNDHDFAMEFSPILYIESMSKLMCGILNKILDCQNEAVMERLLKVASNPDLAEESDVNGGEEEFHDTQEVLKNNKLHLNGNGYATPNGVINPENHFETNSFGSDHVQLYSGGALEISPGHMKAIKILLDIALQKMEFLDRGETYIVYLTFSRLRIGYLAKAYILQVIGAGMFTDNIPVKAARKIFKNCLSIYDVMLDVNLGPTVIQLGALTTFKDETVGSMLTKSFTSLVSNPDFAYCKQAAQSVAIASRILSQDAVVTTIYTLTNLLGGDINRNFRRTIGRGVEGLSRVPLDSSIAMNMNTSQTNLTLGQYKINLANTTGILTPVRDYDEGDLGKVFENAVVAVTEISKACEDETVATLASTILLQKIVNSQPDHAAVLLDGLTGIASSLPEREFIIFIRILHRLASDVHSHLFNVVADARLKLSRKIRNLALFEVYLKDLLELIRGIGDVTEFEHHRPHVEISEIGEKIAILLPPLAEALPDLRSGEKALTLPTELAKLMRDIWFNMVVHGYLEDLKIVKKHSVELERIVYSTPPLASEKLWDRTETLFELNTVLRRGLSNHNVKAHKHIISGIFEISRGISYPKLMFLAATAFVELLRVKLGDCSTILNYLSDPSSQTTGVDKSISQISFKIVRDYIYFVQTGANPAFLNLKVAHQLNKMLVLCCHRVQSLQDAAIQCCDLLINKEPLSLCRLVSLFALFDILALLFTLIADVDRNRYSPRIDYTAALTGVELLLPDLVKWRRETFSRLQEKARNWVKLVLLKANEDVSSLCQSYVSKMTAFHTEKVQYGVLFALEIVSSIGPSNRELIHLLNVSTQHFNTTALFLLGTFSGFSVNSNEKLSEILNRLRSKGIQGTNLLQDCAILAIRGVSSAEMVRNLVEIPFKIFDGPLMKVACSIWFAVIRARESLSINLIADICRHWELSIDLKKGLFSQENDLILPEWSKMVYGPLDSRISDAADLVAAKIKPHLVLIRLMTLIFDANLNRSDHLLKIITQFVEAGLTALAKDALVHPYARLARFELVKFSFIVLKTHRQLQLRLVNRLTTLMFDALLAWFKKRAAFPFGGNLLKIKADFALLKEVSKMIKSLQVPNYQALNDKKSILLYFFDDEISKIAVWLNPLNPSSTRGHDLDDISSLTIMHAYKIDPGLAIALSLRYKVKNLDDLLQKLISENPVPALKYPDAVQFLIGINAREIMPTYHLLFWEALSPIDAITLFLPPFESNPFILQYTMRSLESSDVNLAFFYVPQIVQLLRFDKKGYVERYILETAHVLQLFAHQIIWNMLANLYRDEEATDPDDLKPVLDKIQKLMIKSFSERDKKIYEREFSFFGEVTDILGKLKPYIKKLKAEKKVKIDEEMAKIEILPDVYLPLNPDGTVIDIGRKLGKPLQSHAKAPFMATFKIRKGDPTLGWVDQWQLAIFKVGDDCRQDVLILQLVAVFRSIWERAGVDLYVFPNRVTATAPGCGVIDVLPNSVLRDMLGREAVNGLYEYFISKFGPELLKEFQAARLNFVRSLAAYLIILYLLQFKDRHNGNIMYDDQGHILHIDFGFCFDIVPGGVKFEMAPFKLTHEMVLVLGGLSNTQAFEFFEELCVKGYLACRPYMETIVRCVNPMLESGLPCFKDTTIKKLRARFTPSKLEKDALLHMRGLIKKLLEAYSTRGYDEFQRITNGIPY